MRAEKSAVSAKIAAFLLIITGIGIICFGVWLFSLQSGFIKDTLPVTGYVTEVSKRTERSKVGSQRAKTVTYYDTYVTYTVNRQEYTQKIGSYGHETETGTEMEIFYDPENPQRITDGKVNMTALIVPTVFGIFISGFGTLWLILILKGNIKRNRLMDEGVKMTGTVIRIEEEKSIVINGRHPYKVICRVTDSETGEFHDYASAPIDGIRNISEGTAVDVYVHRERFDIGYVHMDGIMN